MTVQLGTTSTLHGVAAMRDMRGPALFVGFPHTSWRRNLAGLIALWMTMQVHGRVSTSGNNTVTPHCGPQC